MRNIELDTLEIFQMVAREGGIVRAADRLNRVPSNITTRIKQLEQRLETPLFHRQGRGIALTPAGQSLLIHANRLLAIAKQIEAEMMVAQSKLPLRLGAMESTAGARLPAVLARFHEECPQVAIDLKTGTTSSLVKKVSDYELDAAFVGEPFLGAGLESTVVFEERLVLVSARNHAVVTKPSDILDATLLAFPKGCSYRTRLEEWLASELVLPRSVMDLASYHAIIAAAAAGAGYGIVPVSLLNTVTAAQDIKAHELPDGISVNHTHLIWNDGATSQVAKLLSLLC